MPDAEKNFFATGETINLYLLLRFLRGMVVKSVEHPQSPSTVMGNRAVKFILVSRTAFNGKL